MAKTKYIQHFCAYCHKDTKMELVGEMHAEGKESDGFRVWFRCTRCKHSALIERPNKQRNGAPPEIDRVSFVEYSKEKVFLVGQTIFHPEWKDYGRVMGKRRISSGTSSITVTFEKQGERRLLENIKAEDEKAFA